jgi:C-terminal processing protease CtpA/Prc
MFPWILACQGSADPSADDSSTPVDDSAVDTPVALSDEWCERVAAGPASTATLLGALSDAHADIRLFGYADDFATVDRALASVLEGGIEPDLDAYAAQLAEVCVLASSDRTLGPATVDVNGGIAWVRPGTGTVELPGGVTGAVLDLRDLSSTPELAAALDVAVAPLLGEDLPRADRAARVFDGYPDQVFSLAYNVYSESLVVVDRTPLVATGTSLPLWVVTGAVMAPEAVEMAATLEQESRAEIVGRSLVTAVAESRWAPIGDGGLAYRAYTFVRWPDEIEADVETDDPDRATFDPAAWSGPSATDGSFHRAELESRAPFHGDVDPALTPGTLRADLIAIHGTVRRFWRYFDLTNDDLDERLEEVLAAVPDPIDRTLAVELLGRLGEAMHDGHVFFGDWSGKLPAPAGYLPVIIDHVDGVPVVARSGSKDLLPGDRFVSVDGQPIEDLYAERLAWKGAATDGYARDLVARTLKVMDGDTTYVVADPDGTERTITVSPSPLEDLQALGFVFHPRQNGFLDDLGAPDVAYLNLADDVTTSSAQVTELLAAANDAKATGLVVDMRGYPGIDHYAAAEKLVDVPFSSASFGVNVWRGPDDLFVDESAYSLSPSSGTRWNGPMVLLVGPITVSAAENFCIMLLQATELTVVGRQSAGTNGNITGLYLPGQLWFSFTGMELLFPDGSTFHGVGIVPDVEVSPTAADYRDGVDPELVEAASILSGK